MIRVLQIGLGPNPGGVENCIMNYYRAINRNEFQFDFIDVYGKGLAYADEILSMGGRIYSLLSFKKNPLKMAKQLKVILLQEKYDIIHINILSAANMLPILLSCRYSTAKVIVHSHNSSIPSGWVRRILNSLNVHLLRKLQVEKWACGLMAGQWMWGKDFSTDDIVYNAVKFEQYEKNDVIRNEIRERCGFKQNEIVVGFVGRLSEQKNPLFLIDIIRCLVKQDEKFKLLIIGDGELRSNLEELIRQYNIENNVYFAGVRNNVNDWYKAMDLFVLPSLFEGLPLVGIEAQASGLPCFFSDRITEEVNVTNTVKYLPINNGMMLWIEAINYCMENGEMNPIIFPENYKVDYAVKILTEKYIRVLNKKVDYA